MSLRPITKTPTKDNESPRPFVKPADLFKMRRRTSNANNVNNSAPSPLAFNSRPAMSMSHNNSNSMNNNNNNNSNSNSCSTPNKNLATGSRFSPAKIAFDQQSPLKCLNNISDPSPVKKLPVLLRNPFNQPVKRRLNLGHSPKKDGSRSPNKRSRIMEMDEDANLEPPKMQIKLKQKDKTNGPCDLNDWTLRTKMRVNFWAECKNWNDNTTSIHKRRIGTAIEESPSKLDDKTISIEAIKNAATVYQHPYLSWQTMFPRITLGFDKRKQDGSFTLTKHSQISKMMHKDWCESFNDLINLLIGGRCPYFYMCSDNYNILFKQTPTSNPRQPLVQAYISPFYYGLGCELNKIEVKFECPEMSRSDSSNALSQMAKESSQTSFGSTRNSVLIDEESSQSIHQNGSKVAPSIDSGNVSDLEDFGDEENSTSQILDRLGLSQQAFSTIQLRPKGFIEAESNTQTKLSSKKGLAVIEGTENLRKLVNFLQTNRLYTISNVGKFACIPPTLLSPREFRLSTPQYPEVVVDKKIVRPDSTNEEKQAASSKISNQNNEPNSQTYIELRGPILPNSYTELHKLLICSSNLEHTCQSTPLESTLAYKNIGSAP